MFGPFATFLVTLVFYIKTTLKLRKYDKELMDSRSNLEQATTEWFMIITFIIFIEIGLWFGFALIATYGTIARLLFPLVTIVGWVMMAHYAMIQKHEPAKPIVKEIESEEQDDVEKSTIDLVHDSLVALMEEKQFYLNPDLTIDMLAEELHTNTTYIYLAIHEGLGSNFYEFVNGLRISTACEYLLQSDKTMDEISRSCGFNSTRSLQRTFKRLKGCAPSEWRANQQRIEEE